MSAPGRPPAPIPRGAARGAGPASHAQPAAALPSIWRRLSATLWLMSLAWGLTVSVVVWQVVGHEVDEIMDDALLEAAEVLHGVLGLQGQPRHATPAAPAIGQAHEEHLWWQIVDAQGQVLQRSHKAPAHSLVGAPLPGFRDVGADWRLHAMALASEGRLLLVAQPMRERTQARLEAGQYTAGSAFAVGALFALWFGRRVRSELSPVTRLSDAVARYDPLRDDATLAGPERAELQPMHAAILALGSGLGARVRSERAFASHAAHALRTPLAGLMAQLAVAQRLSPAQAQPTLAMARQATGRLRSVVSALLTLFRSGHVLNVQPVDLAALVKQLPADGLQVHTHPGAPLVADPDLLAAALANLLDNAARHGAQQVWVYGPGEDGPAEVQVHDDGPGLAPARLQALQQALDTQDYEQHTGLGLMLADRVARAHGGHARLLAPGSAQAQGPGQVHGPGPGFGFGVALRLG